MASAGNAAAPGISIPLDDVDAFAGGLAADTAGVVSTDAEDETDGAPGEPTTAAVLGIQLGVRDRSDARVILRQPWNHPAEVAATLNAQNS